MFGGLLSAGGVLEVVGLSLHVPVGVWLFLAFVSLSVAQYKAFRRVLSELEAVSQTQLDVTVGGVQDIPAADNRGRHVRLKDVSITNQSTTQKVSLKFWLRIPIGSGTEVLLEAAPCPANTPNKIPVPVDLTPVSTTPPGDLVFPVIAFESVLPKLVTSAFLEIDNRGMGKRAYTGRVPNPYKPNFLFDTNPPVEHPESGG